MGGSLGSGLSWMSWWKNEDQTTSPASMWILSSLAKTGGWWIHPPFPSRLASTVKLSVSVPDHLWEAAQVARTVEKLVPGTHGRLGVTHPLNPSLLIQLGLQALVRDGWGENAEVMQLWLDDVKRVMAEGILKTTRGSQPVAKVVRGAKRRKIGRASCRERV